MLTGIGDHAPGLEGPVTLGAAVVDLDVGAVPNVGCQRGVHVGEVSGGAARFEHIDPDRIGRTLGVLSHGAQR